MQQRSEARSLSTDTEDRKHPLLHRLAVERPMIGCRDAVPPSLAIAIPGCEAMGAGFSGHDLSASHGAAVEACRRSAG